MKIGNIDVQRENELLHTWVLVKWDDVGVLQSLVVDIDRPNEKSKGRLTKRTGYKVYQPYSGCYNIDADQIVAVVDKIKC